MHSEEPDPLETFLPPNCLPVIRQQLNRSSVELRICKPRLTKLGDYRPPFKDKGHRISVNNDLNPYSFLITLVHEIAHMYTYLTYGRNAKAHGPEWKSYYRQLMQPYIQLNVLPADVEEALKSFMDRITASSCADKGLNDVLNRYNSKKPGTYVEELSSGDIFLFRQKAYRVEQKLRKRYKCRQLATGKMYLFSALAEVEPIRIETK